MLLLFIGDFFRRRRRRLPRANDEIPTEPLIHVMLFWALFGLGALFGAFAIAAVVAMSTEGRDAISVTALAVTAPASGACLAGSIHYWKKLRK